MFGTHLQNEMFETLPVPKGKSICTVLERDSLMNGNHGQITPHPLSSDQRYTSSAADGKRAKCVITATVMGQRTNHINIWMM